MATLSVYVCPGSNQTVDPSTGSPGCTSGAGAWQAVTLAEPFDPATLDTDSLAAAFGAGFILIGTGAILGYTVNVLIDTARKMR